MNGYVHGRRSRGRPTKRWIDVVPVHDDCKKMNVDLHTATHMCIDRILWRKYVKELSMSVDDKAISQLISQSRH